MVAPSLKRVKLQIYRQIDNVKFGECAVTVGMFDGVHKGHQKLISELVTIAKTKHLQSVVVTLWPHPKLVLGKGDVALLSTLDEKAREIEKLGVDAFVILDFTKQFAMLTPTRFVREVLVGQLNARHFHMGFNHHFGSGNCTLDELQAICESEHLSSSRGEQFESAESGACSSSEIRRHLESGAIDAVCNLLGRPYELEGEIVHGDGIGRTIGFPTANLSVAEKSKLLPANGVYAAMALVDEKQIKAVVNIGMRPTIDGHEQRIEAHLLDFSEKIYGRKMTILFFSRIRDEKRFATLKELENQIVKDVEESESYFVSLAMRTKTL